MPSDGGGVYAMRRRYRQTRRAGFSCRVRKPDSKQSCCFFVVNGLVVVRCQWVLPGGSAPTGRSAPRFSPVFRISIGCFFFL